VRTDTTPTASQSSGQSPSTGQARLPGREPRGPRQAAPPPTRYRAVHDRVALDEIELYAELIIAAERSQERLSQQDIDRILGLTVRA
jgi:hypothetical protein